MRRTANRSQRVARKKAAKNGFGRIRLWSFFAILAISIGLVFYLLFFSSYLCVEDVRLENSDTISDDQVLASVNPVLNSNVFYFLPAKNMFLLPMEELTDKIIADIHQINTVEIRKEYPRTMIVRITERAPVMIWETDSAAYKMDVNGVVTSQTHMDDDSLPELRSRVDEPYAEHDAVIDNDLVEFFLELQNKFTQRTSIAITFCYMPSPVSGRVHVATEEGWEVHFDASRDVNTQLAALLTIMNDRLEEDRSNVEYIDISSEGWVYLK